MTDVLDDGRVRLICGDSLDVLPTLDEGSVDAVVTDPPYGLGFMGQEWDRIGDTGRGARARVERADEVTPAGEGHSTSVGPYLASGVDSLRSAGAPFQSWCLTWAKEILRVLKPGGHLLAFGGTRTYHRLACGIEDAGFVIRDSILDPLDLGPLLAWIYGSGFPKSLDVSKAIDRAAGAVREVVGPSRRHGGGANDKYAQDDWTRENAAKMGMVVTAPATPEAAEWEGWGTALKPAWEPIVVARKPLVGTVAANVLAHGTGALNIDGCRVGINAGWAYPNGRGGQGWHGRESLGRNLDEPVAATAGRWPANVALCHGPDCLQVGERKVKGISGGTGNHDGSVYGARTRQGEKVKDYAAPDGTETVLAWDCQPGCPVAALDEQAGERPSGRLEPHHRRTVPRMGTNAYGEDAGDPESATLGRSFGGDTGGPSRFFYTAKASTAERDGATHPTVKPLELMRWLVRLVTPPGGLVLDPFAGSGTTLLAARAEGFRALGIEREPDYARQAAERYRRRWDPAAAEWGSDSQTLFGAA